jgi:SAM-dependent methyltransferase
MNSNAGTPTQARLSAAQVAEFYHDQFVRDQVSDFTALIPPRELANKVVVDVGGGCGFFAKALTESGQYAVRVVDTDAASVAACRRIGVPATCEDALNPSFGENDGAVCFNLILHHLVSASEKATADLQCAALAVWRQKVRFVFVNEYIYESYVPNLSGRLIYEITKSSMASAIGAVVARYVKAFRANTFGVGVRFRSHAEWRGLFERAGYSVLGSRLGVREVVSPALRSLLIREIRRDSYLLAPQSRDSLRPQGGA